MRKHLSHSENKTITIMLIIPLRILKKLKVVNTYKIIVYMWPSILRGVSNSFKCQKLASEIVE